ncbi:geranylgeranyl reductase family protein [Thermovibrio sp.]
MVYDVIVSGLGPAGCAFLKSIEGTGLKVLALEKEEFPRRKPCAGGLTLKAYLKLKSLFPEVDKVVRVRSKELELHYLKRRVLINFPSPFVYLTDRKELDNFLFNSVSSSEFKVHTKEALVKAEYEGELIKVSSSKDTYRCRVLISAEGVNSKLSSIFKLKREVGFTYEIDLKSSWSERVLIDFSSFNWGYYWLFPKGDFITVGVGEFKSREIFKRLRELLKEINQKHGLRGKVISERGYPIPAGKKVNDVYRERLLFLGDAGGLVDPLTGEGIYYAVKSGLIAGNFVKEAFKKGDLSFLSGYKETVNEEFGKEFFWARVIGRLFFPLRGLNFRLLENSGELALLAGKLLSGEISYKRGFFEYIVRAPRALIGI